MDNRVKLLIAVGASFTANCQPCLNTAIAQAEASGVQKEEILEAIAIGRVVRKGTMGKMDKLVATLTGKSLSDSPEDCPFGTTEEDVKQWVNQEEQCECSQPTERRET